MARGLPTVPRGDGPGVGPAAVLAVLVAVLTALLLPPADGGAPRVPDHVASAVEGRVVSAFEVARADSGASADDGHCAVLLRSPRDVPGERPAPSVTVAVAAHRETVGPPWLVRTASPAAPIPPAAPPPTGRHQGRAPPSAPGT
ncbi:hypothetical protein [Streptomyces bottropensis]|uniref:hypothetical protein n=1 Tax=Streptomyces bottropensis TaxID=42235 RepID=UPI0036739060